MKVFNQEIALSYESDIRKKVLAYEGLHEVIESLIFSLINVNEHILIVGAGTGEELNYLKKLDQSIKIDAIEPAAEMAKIFDAKAEALNLTSRVSLFEDSLESFKSNDKYHVITSILVSHFINHNDKKNFFLKLKNLIDQKGFILLVDKFSNENASLFNEQAWLKNLSIKGFSDDEIKKIALNLSTKFFTLSENELHALCDDVGLVVAERFFQSLNFKGFILTSR